MGIYMLAFLIGVVAGLRAMTAPAAVSWGAALGWLHLKGTWLAWMPAGVATVSTPKPRSRAAIRARA